ncbi:hypothetical protein [Floridanema evergladense]|uniref:Ribbon-helix-helix protein CopG domain-containing protein n=1 Tax=Floridaenema evergladense BLCC-F167 TaxID=3153639 RepID=A0ABV4WD41_9CYAN
MNWVIYMARTEIVFSTNLSLAIALLCELQGISKSQFLRMAALQYAAEILYQGNVENLNKIYLVSLLRLAIEESSDKELSPSFKSRFLETLNNGFP